MKDIHILYHTKTNPQELVDAITKDNVNAKDADGYSLLDKACYNGQPILAKMLIEKGATVDNPTLQTLAQSRKPDASLAIFKIILPKIQSIKGLPIDAPEAIRYKKKLIFTAVENGNIALADELFQNHIQGEEKTSIQEDILSFIDNGKDLNLRSNFCKLQNVDFSTFTKKLKDNILDGNHEKVQLSLEVCSSQQINTIYHDPTTKKSKSLLTLAYEKKIALEGEIKESKYSEVIKLKQNAVDDLHKSMNLLLKNPLFNIESTLDQNPTILRDAYIALDTPSNDPNVELKAEKQKTREEFFLNLLFNKGTLPYLQTLGKDLLMLAAQKGDAKTYYYIRKNNADFNSPDALGNTQLLYAAQSGSSYIFDKLMLEDHALLTKNKIGTNILMAACAGHNQEIIASVLDKANPKDVDKQGNNALHYLSRKSKSKNTKEIIGILLEKGIPIDQKNKEGLTPLMMAIAGNNVSLVRELLDRGANVNAADNLGNTALIYACHFNKQEMIETILSANDLNVAHKNNAGVSAYSIAAHRDWLVEGSGKAVNEAALNQDTPPLKEDKIKRSDEINSFPGLTQALLARGADPYEFSPNTIFGSAMFASAALMVAKGGSILEDLTKNETFPFVATAGRAINMLASVFAGWTVGTKAKETIKNWLLPFLTKEEDDKRLNLENKIMIGSLHAERLTIKRGKALEEDIKAHVNFINYSAIYDVEQFKLKIEELKNKPNFQFTNWVKEAHEDLTNQYIAIQHRIKNQPWHYSLLPWKGKALKDTEKEILKAYECFVENDATKKLFTIAPRDILACPFKDEYKNLIDTINSPKKSKILLKMLIEDPTNHEYKRISTVIQSVVNKEILVSPDTYYQFMKFSQEEKLTLQNPELKKNLQKLKINSKFILPTITGNSITSFQESAKATIDTAANRIAAHPQDKTWTMSLRKTRPLSKLITLSPNYV